MIEHDLFIDGAYRKTTERFENRDPTTGALISRVARASDSDVDDAVKAAERALKGPWGKMSAGARAELMEKIAAEIDRRKDDFIRAEILDTGKPLSQASTIDIPRGGANFRTFAQMLKADFSEFFETHTQDGQGALNYVIRKPVGVVGVICPWNLPFLLMTWKVAPALAAGNTVVVKPSEETPATATLLGEVMNAVGVPKGVYNVVHGFGAGEAGEALVKHPSVRAITFTGESATGSAIQKTAAPWVKPLSFELGGKNAAVIFDDCNLDDAIAGTLRSVFTNCGQVCLCSERVYVQSGIYDTFVERLKEATATLISGDPYNEATNFGPLISKTHQQKVQRYFDLAKEEGGEIVVGGGPREMSAPYSDGYWVEPTIVTGLKQNARFVQEEIFGPTCHIMPFDEEEQAVELANDSPYGLCAAVWTQNLGRAHRVSAAIDVGVAWVNTWYLRDLRTPFGGSKLSGIGREGGRYSFEFYTELQNICIKL